MSPAWSDESCVAEPAQASRNGTPEMRFSVFFIALPRATFPRSGVFNI
jgi:hypothetical protein